MVDGYTFQKGTTTNTFSSRAELYDHMIEQGEFYLAGDEAGKMLKHIERRLITTKKDDKKWIAAREKLLDNGVE
jgi:hypothetical protein